MTVLTEVRDRVKSVQHGGIVVSIVLVLLGFGATCHDAFAKHLFPTDLPSREWVLFPAVGYNNPVTGVIHRLDKAPTCGMALGGIDTGCIDLESSGLWGYSSLFNSISPRRGPLNLPFLGLGVDGRVWVLCDPKQIKHPDYAGRIAGPAEPYLTTLDLGVAGTACEIHYWGHYPVVDLEYETDSPVEVSLRAWAPFLPGDLEASMIPGIVFEVHLRNPDKNTHQTTVALSFPGPSINEAGTNQFRRRDLSGPLKGVLVNASRANYVLAVSGEEKTRIGGELGSVGTAWADIQQRLPEALQSEPGSSVAVDCDLGAGEDRVIRFILTWLAPKWRTGEESVSNYAYQAYPWSEKGEFLHHMYAVQYGDAEATARLLSEFHPSLLSRILAWQETIFSDESLPIWLRDSLVNNLYLITEDGLWAAAEYPIPHWVLPEDGLFGMSESPRSCPQIECVPCTFYGNWPIVYFFPRLALSTLRGYKGYQYPDGKTHWVWGTDARFTHPLTGHQESLTGVCFASMVDRYRMCWGDKEFTREFYEPVKKITEWTAKARPQYSTGEAVISMPSWAIPIDHWFEADPGWFGMVPHVGGLHLAQFRIAERMALEMGDEAFAHRCRRWIEDGSRALEEKCWLGTHYLTYWEPESNKRSDVVFGYQLDGEWLADFHGLPGVFPKHRIDTTLDTIRRCNVALSKSGAINYANLDGTPVAVGGYGPYSYFQAEVLMLAMAYMYEGQRDFGLELARRCWENVILKWGNAWNLPNRAIGQEDTAACLWTDYYQLMMLWGLPAAIQGGDLAAPCQPGGLVDRILKAAERQ